MPKLKSAGRVQPVDLHVGARAKSRRMQMGMSQSKLANKLGVTFQQIQKYEKGLNRISASHLHQMARVLEVTPLYFFENPLTEVASRNDRMSADAFDVFCASRDGIALMRAFVKIKDHALRHKLAKMVEQIAG